MSEREPEAAAAAVGTLDGVRVVELSETAAGAYCGRLLAGLGAEVTMLEPHSGSPFRRKGPFRDDVPDLEGGATHLHLNRRKGSLRVDLRTAAGRRLFETRLNEAKVLISMWIDGESTDWIPTPFARRTPTSMSVRSRRMESRDQRPTGSVPS